MFRKDDRIFFSEEDKKNVSVKKYTTKELNNNEKQFRKKRNCRRYSFLIIIFADIVLSYLIEKLEYPLYIILAFMIFISILCEYIDRYNLKAIQRKYYIEIEVLEKMEPEVIMEQTLSPGSKATRFFPVKGMDTGTKYESVFYVEQNQYGANIGDKIRISIKGEKL